MFILKLLTLVLVMGNSPLQAHSIGQVYDTPSLPGKYEQSVTPNVKSNSLVKHGRMDEKNRKHHLKEKARVFPLLGNGAKIEKPYRRESNLSGGVVILTENSRSVRPFPNRVAKLATALGSEQRQHEHIEIGKLVKENNGIVDEKTEKGEVGNSARHSPYLSGKSVNLESPSSKGLFQETHKGLPTLALIGNSVQGLENRKNEGTKNQQNVVIRTENSVSVRPMKTMSASNFRSPPVSNDPKQSQHPVIFNDNPVQPVRVTKSRSGGSNIQNTAPISLASMGNSASDELHKSEGRLPHGHMIIRTENSVSVRPNPNRVLKATPVSNFGERRLQKVGKKFHSGSNAVFQSLNVNAGPLERKKNGGGPEDNAQVSLPSVGKNLREDHDQGKETKLQDSVVIQTENSVSVKLNPNRVMKAVPVTNFGERRLQTVGKKFHHGNNADFQSLKEGEGAMEGKKNGGRTGNMAQVPLSLVGESLSANYDHGKGTNFQDSVVIRTENSVSVRPNPNKVMKAAPVSNFGERRLHKKGKKFHHGSSPAFQAMQGRKNGGRPENTEQVPLSLVGESLSADHDHGKGTKLQDSVIVRTENSVSVRPNPHKVMKAAPVSNYRERRLHKVDKKFHHGSSPVFQAMEGKNNGSRPENTAQAPLSLVGESLSADHDHRIGTKYQHSLVIQTEKGVSVKPNPNKVVKATPVSNYRERRLQKMDNQFYHSENAGFQASNVNQFPHGMNAGFQASKVNKENMEWKTNGLSSTTNGAPVPFALVGKGVNVYPDNTKGTKFQPGLIIRTENSVSVRPIPNKVMKAAPVSNPGRIPFQQDINQSHHGVVNPVEVNNGRMDGINGGVKLGKNVGEGVALGLVEKVVGLEGLNNNQPNFPGTVVINRENGSSMKPAQMQNPGSHHEDTKVAMNGVPLQAANAVGVTAHNNMLTDSITKHHQKGETTDKTTAIFKAIPTYVHQQLQQTAVKNHKPVNNQLNTGLHLSLKGGPAYQGNEVKQPANHAPYSSSLFAHNEAKEPHRFMGKSHPPNLGLPSLVDKPIQVTGVDRPKHPNLGAITKPLTVNPSAGTSHPPNLGLPSLVDKPIQVTGVDRPKHPELAAITKPLSVSPSAGTSHPPNLGLPSLVDKPIQVTGVDRPKHPELAAITKPLSVNPSAGTSHSPNVGLPSLVDKPIQVTGVDRPKHPNLAAITKPLSTNPSAGTSHSPNLGLPSLVDKPIQVTGVKRPKHPNLGAITKPLSVNPSAVLQLERIALAEHQRFRTMHQSGPLLLSKVLVTEAQRFAKKLSMEGKLTHENRVELTKMNEGENLGMVCSKSFISPARKVKRIVQKWYEEACHYNFHKPLISDETARFTQLVWSASKELGVGVAQGKWHGKDCVFVVARYRPMGNIQDKRQFQDNVKQKHPSQPIKCRIKDKDEYY